jgi:hypothetical protein
MLDIRGRMSVTATIRHASRRTSASGRLGRTLVWLLLLVLLVRADPALLAALAEVLSALAALSG